MNPYPMVNSSLTKEAKIYNGEKTVSHKSVKLEHSLTLHIKTNSECFKDLNRRHDTMKFLEENISQSILGYKLQHFFLAQSP